jgi:predicted metal-binding membrane protein
MRIGVSDQMASWPWAWTLAAFLGGWVVMMAAMMFPAAAPMTHAFARSTRGTNAPARATLLIALFLSGYLLVWGGLGLAVFLANELASELADNSDRIVDAGPYIGGVFLIGAGIYQFTSFKQWCLSKCRSPLSFVLKEWRSGTVGALAMGVKHGLYCLGCCIGLMVGLIVVGVMSIPWMVTLACLIFAEKVTRWGPQIARATAVVMFAAGVALIVYGEKLPGLA